MSAVVNAYVPNAGEGLKRLEYRLDSWDVAFSGYLASLGMRKPVILTGDLNCAPQPIDIHKPKRWSPKALPPLNPPPLFAL